MPKLTRQYMLKRALAREDRNYSHDYVKGKRIRVNDTFQHGYSYVLSENYGKKIKTQIDGSGIFAPQLSPKAMLRMGVFEGKYLNDCVNEFPVDWFVNTDRRGNIIDIIETLSPERANPDINYFGIKSRMSLYDWEKNGWIPVVYSKAAGPVLRKYGVRPSQIEDPDPRGWFQWYCRYFIGRRLDIIDEIQMKRWYAFRRHAAQLKKHCKQHDEECHKKQRQALLQWAYYDVWRIKDL